VGAARLSEPLDLSTGDPMVDNPAHGADGPATRQCALTWSLSFSTARFSQLLVLLLVAVPRAQVVTVPKPTDSHRTLVLNCR